jgi:hypothetical protein
MSIEEFFSQMRIVLKAAEKSYEGMVKGVELTEDKTPYLSFRQHPEISELMDKLGHIHKEEILLETTEDEWQEISLEINRL